MLILLNLEVGTSLLPSSGADFIPARCPVAIPGPPGKEGVSQELGGGQPENRTNLGFLGTAGPLFSSGLDALMREQWKDEGKGEAVLWLCLGLKMCSLAGKALVIHYQSVHGSETILLHISQSLFCSSCR